MSGWADLPQDILALVMHQLCSLAQGRPAAAAIKILTGVTQVNKRWRSVATAEVRV